MCTSAYVCACARVCAHVCVCVCLHVGLGFRRMGSATMALPENKSIWTIQSILIFGLRMGAHPQLADLCHPSYLSATPHTSKQKSAWGPSWGPAAPRDHLRLWSKREGHHTTPGLFVLASALISVPPLIPPNRSRPGDNHRSRLPPETISGSGAEGGPS